MNRFKKDRFLFFLLCDLCVLCGSSFSVSPVLAQEQWTFLPPSPLFESLIGDPREPHTAITAYLDKNRYEGEVGGVVDLLRFEPGDGTHWGWGISGSGFILLDQFGATFPMRGGDWYANMFLSQASGDFSHRFEFTHESSHLGDSLQGIQAPIFFSRESLRFTSSFKPSDSLRFYAGVGDWYNMYPAGDPWFASIGAEIYSPSTLLLGHPLRAYGSFDLKWKGESAKALSYPILAGTSRPSSWNKTIQVGLQWKLEKEGSRALRLAVIYYSGLNEFGQFYLTPDEHWALGVYFDP